MRKSEVAEYLQCSMLENWIEFMTSSVSTKHEGAGGLVVEFGNMASSPDSLCVHKSS